MGENECPAEDIGELVRDIKRTPVDEPRLRQCAVTRTSRPKEQLIRFVADPDGVILPDLACKLPGRGIWLTADRVNIEAAIGSSAFSRSLRMKVSVPDSLSDTVERLLEKRVAGALSLANKAGCVVSGFDKVFRLVERGRAFALVHASDGAAGGCEKLDRKMRAMKASKSEEVAQIFGNLLDRDQMSLAIGRPNVIHAGLSEGGASAKFIAEARRLACYRDGIGGGVPP